MLLLSHFVFFDYTEPVICFLSDYLAVMGLFVLLGFYLAKILKIRWRSFAPQCTSEFYDEKQCNGAAGFAAGIPSGFQVGFLFKDQQDFNMKQRAQGGSLLEC